MTAQQIIDALQLIPLPIEGGFFRETWRSPAMIPAEAGRGPAASARDRIAGSAIYYLLTDDEDVFSALHRLPTDEVYHFYLGDPVDQWHLHDDGRVDHLVLGPDLALGQHVQAVAPRGAWQGSRLRPGGRFALMGTTMAPGFDADDYDHGDRESLLAAHPHQRDLVLALTRV
jgi:predicted cupin superfamily sugar epimerase